MPSPSPSASAPGPGTLSAPSSKRAAHAGKPAARVAPKAGEPCTGRELRAELKRPGRTSAGRVVTALGLRNKSSNPCTIDGYPGLQLLAAGADPISTSPLETGSKQMISLARGATAWAELSWSAVAGPGEPATGACGPAPAQLAVFAPDDTVEMDVAFSAGPVCGNGQIKVGALTLRSPL